MDSSSRPDPVSLSLGELAVRFGCELRGDPDLRVERVAPLAEADARSVSFLANPRYRSQLRSTRAGAVIVGADHAEDVPGAALVAARPYVTFARVAAALHPAPSAEPGIHPTAVVDPLAVVDPTAHVGALAVIGARCRVGPRAFIGPGCMLEADVHVTEDVRLVARVTLCRDVHVGARTIVQPGAVIGGDGFGFARDRAGWVKVPQVGGVRIGADVEIGANTTIDRGAMGDTVIGDDVKLDNQIQVAHNVRIGAHTAMAACVGVSGSVTIGERCQIGGAVGIAGHLEICDDVIVTGLSFVSHSIRTPGAYSSGIPIEDAREWRRIVGRLKRIDRLATRVAALERETGRPDQEEQ
jgi:UDP-3-O-[3-hydroxymyristoyl] glucosamine N-acyltransferase